MSLSSRWQHLCTISIMLGGASKYAAERLVSRLGTTTSSFRFGGRAVQAAAADLPTSSSSIVQAAADLGSCHQPARQEDPAPHQKDLQHLLLSPRQLHHGLLGSRYRRSGESYHHHSIHHFWIQLKVTELNRVESSSLPKQLLRQIIFY